MTVGEARPFSEASLMQLWNRSMTSSRLRRLGCGVLGARDAARERRRTEAARAMARARARSSWSSLEPSGNAGGGDCSSSLEPTHPMGGRRSRRLRGGGSGGVLGGRHLVGKDGGEGKGIGFGGFAGVGASPDHKSTPLKSTNTRKNQMDYSA